MLLQPSVERETLLDEIHRRLARLGLDARKVRTTMVYIQRASSPGGGEGDRAQPLAPFAKRLIETRSSANAIFGAPVLSDPRLEMLLWLYTQRGVGDGISVGALCAAANLPIATGLRHIEKLDQFGLVTRQGDPDDRRRTWVALTDRAVNAIERLLSDLQARVLAEL